MSEVPTLLDLASECVGGRVIAANDDFFASKENLIKASKPLCIEDRYTDRGKWMDGWETRRRRTPGHDWCIVKLGLPGIVSEIVVDTSYFRGNFPESCSVDACAVAESIDDEPAPGAAWTELLPKVSLTGDSENVFSIRDPYRYTHLRLNIFPDGGVARLRVIGRVVPDWQEILRNDGILDLAAVEHGSRVLNCSDKFFGAPQNLLLPGHSHGMHDGWETQRRRGPGHDWVIIELGVAGTIRAVDVDTSFFKGNFPESCSLEIRSPKGASEPPDSGWRELLPRTTLQADSIQTFEIERSELAKQVRFKIFPDGGVARLRLRGLPDPDALLHASLCWFNSLPLNAALSVLLNCCGSQKWAAKMAHCRPFSDLNNLLNQAERSCDAMGVPDWKEAFASHPKIGESKGGNQQAQRWSQQEQAAAADTSSDLQLRLMKRNGEYYSRFGYIFIVCATGKSAGEMLSMLEQRLQNDPSAELQIAAREQRKITVLRLRKLFGS
jgi:allantoicase